MSKEESQTQGYFKAIQRSRRIDKPGMPSVDDFPWQEFLDARARMVVWFRRWGNEGEPMEFKDIASALSCDPRQAELIYTTMEDK